MALEKDKVFNTVYCKLLDKKRSSVDQFLKFATFLTDLSKAFDTLSTQYNS